MKSIVHNAAARDKVLHIETEGGIVNITVGLSDDEGRPVTHIEILRNVYVDEAWVLDGTVNNRLVDHRDDARCRHCGRRILLGGTLPRDESRRWIHLFSDLGQYCNLAPDSTVAEPEPEAESC